MNKSPVILAAAAFAAATITTASVAHGENVLCAKNSDPSMASTNTASVKLLVIGNSIVRHGPAPKIGWTNNWGMAASAKDKDFAHLVAKGIERGTGCAVELRIHSSWQLERKYKEYDVYKDLASDAEWKPDYVVFALGENIPVFTNAVDSAIWSNDLVQAGQVLKAANPDAKFVFRTTFWPQPSKNKVIVAVAKEVGGSVADLGKRGDDKRNQAIGLFEHGGVAMHPGDLGMKMMAEIILRAFGFPAEDAPESVPSAETADARKPQTSENAD